MRWPGELALTADTRCNGSIAVTPPRALDSSPNVALRPPHRLRESLVLDDAFRPLGEPQKYVVLPASWFRFILHWTLRQSVRHADYMSLVTIRASREYVGLSVDVGSQSLVELAEVVGPAIRETDLIGELDDGRLGLLLAQADD